MSEGNIYFCNWVKESNEFVLSLHANPSISARGEDIAALKVELCDQIILWNGDGEAVLELFPPIEINGTGKNIYVEICYNNNEILENRKDDFYENGYCNKCKHGIGKRTVTSLSLKRVPKEPIIGIKSELPRIEIYSKKFISLFNQNELDLMSFIPVLLNGEETEYVEVVPKKTIKHVGHKGAKYPTKFSQSWRCTECKREVFKSSVEGYEFGTIFISPESLLGDLPSIIFIDTGRNCSMAIRNDRWMQIAKNKDAKKICTSPVVVLKSEYVEIPKLREPGKFNW